VTRFFVAAREKKLTGKKSNKIKANPKDIERHFRSLAVPPLDSQFDNHFLQQCLLTIQQPPITSPSPELDINLTTLEISAALNRMANKAPGEDSITHDELLSIPPDNITHLFNRMMRERSIPTTWKRSILAAVPKAGKDTAIPPNLRGISLQQSLRKLFVSCVTTRVESWVITHNILQPSQIGFRKGYRATDNIFILRCVHERSLANKKPLFVVYVDLKTAFDLTDRRILWAQLRKYGAEGRLIEILKELYSAQRLP
jgi:hypothetical protein